MIICLLFRFVINLRRTSGFNHPDIPHLSLVLLDNPEVLLMLVNLRTEDVEKSQVDLVDIEGVMLVVLVLSPLEDVHIVAVRIVRTAVAASSLD